MSDGGGSGDFDFGGDIGGYGGGEAPDPASDFRADDGNDWDDNVGVNEGEDDYGDNDSGNFDDDGGDDEESGFACGGDGCCGCCKCCILCLISPLWCPCWLAISACKFYCKPKTPNPYRQEYAQGVQNDGEGRIQACLIRTKFGVVPGKLGTMKAWYAHGGKEYEAAGREIFTCNGIVMIRDKDYKRVSPLTGRPLPENSPRPTIPHGYECKKQDGSNQKKRRPVWAALALNTPHGNIPGKVLQNGKCYYSYGGRQYKADRYAYIPINATRDQ